MGTLPLKWWGGKHFIAKWIIGNFPDRESYSHYCEPFAGGLRVLFAHAPIGKSEVVNDLNRELTNFWKVLRSPEHFQEFQRRCHLTPLSEVEWKSSVNEPMDLEDEVTRAFRFFVRYRQSYSGRGGEFCVPTKRAKNINENVGGWLSAVDGLEAAYERLRRVEIRNMYAVDFIRKFDHAKALFYCDPPYLKQTRSRKNAYEFEMSDDDHKQLIECLAVIKGKFVLSGYPSEMYDDILVGRHGFRFVDLQIEKKPSSKKSKATERIWLNF